MKEFLNNLEDPYLKFTSNEEEIEVPFTEVNVIKVLKVKAYMVNIKGKNNC